MDLFWCLHLQTEVRPQAIVNIDRVPNQASELIQSPAFVDQELLLQNTIYSLGQGILVTIIAICH